MKDIYQRASGGVIVHMGLKDDRFLEAYKSRYDVPDVVENVALARRKYDRECSHLLNTTLRPQFQAENNFTKFGAPYPDLVDEELWQVLENFFQRPWFRRSWVL